MNSHGIHKDVLKFLLSDLDTYSERNGGIVIYSSLSKQNANVGKTKISNFLDLPIPNLDIKDIEKVAEKLSELVRIVELKGRNFSWFDYPEDKTKTIVGQFLDRIWFSATHEDFSNPDAFLDNISEMVTNSHLDELSNGVIKGHIPSLGYYLYTKKVSNPWAYEAPYRLEFNLLNSDETHPTSVSSQIPNVLYGICDNSVRIYAVQMPKEGSLPGLRDNQRKKRIRKLAYKIDKSLKKDYWANPYSDEEKEDRDVFRPGIVSLVGAISLFSQIGLGNILVPTILPVRLQDHALRDVRKGNIDLFETKRIYEVTTKKLREIMYRVSYLVKGIEIEKGSGPSGMMRLKLNPPFSSDDTIVDDVIKAICKK